VKYEKMKKLRLNRRARKAFQGNSRGFTLIEVVIAMLLLGVIGVAVLGALSYASTVLITVDRRATAESLAKTQMEYVKSQSYITVNQTGGVATYQKIPDTVGYNISSVSRNGSVVENVIIGIPWNSGNNTAANNDTGLQKIKLIIKYDILRYDITSRNSTLVGKNFTLEDYKRQS
jgi:prepilin-type N-terminal cleavage/methylation domain-containing protein